MVCFVGVHLGIVSKLVKVSDFKTENSQVIKFIDFMLLILEVAQAVLWYQL